jgi:hypothetical protein
MAKCHQGFIPHHSLKEKWTTEPIGIVINTIRVESDINSQHFITTMTAISKSKLSRFQKCLEKRFMTANLNKLENIV